MLQDAVLDHHQPLAGNAFAIERTRGRAAHDQRIVGDRKAGFQHLLAHLVAQEAGFARDRRAIDGASDVADETAGDARIEDDGDALAGIDLTRIEALDGTLAGAAADSAASSSSA
ncbi:hypothetical protein AJ87_15600 [Rhizobium yanglingense]|nr:hypothetical protein AJ87_15600 [Rhizobium yanglingense]